MHAQDHLRKTGPTAAALGLLALVLGMAALSNGARADTDEDARFGRRQGEVFDSRYHHDRFYPARGAGVRALPRAAVSVPFRGRPYYFHDGIWYRPSGPRFVVIAPPFGAVVPFLPGSYTAVWFGGVPYYYANDVYYQWLPDRRGYVVTPPPPEANVSTQPPASVANDEPFVYPKNGQSEQQQGTDRYECHRWATNQTSFDPTRDGAVTSPEDAHAKRADYFRAMSACLEARGYTVR